MFTYDPKTHKVMLTTYHDGGQTKGLVLVFATPLKANEIRPTIYRMVRDYLSTPGGQAVLQRNNGVFDYGDLVDNIMPSFSAPYGLVLAAAIPSDIETDHDENLAQYLDIKPCEPLPLENMDSQQLAALLQTQPHTHISDLAKECLMNMDAFIESVESGCIIDDDGCGDLVFNDRTIDMAVLDLPNQSVVIGQDSIKLRTLYNKLGDAVRVAWYNK